MPNPDSNNNDFNSRKHSVKPPPNNSPGSHSTVNEKAVGWPGLPGKAQPKSRNEGVKKTKIYPTSVGI